MSAQISEQRLLRLTETRQSMRETSIVDAKARSFYPSVMCQTCLPVYSVPGNQYYRKVGDTHLNVMVPQQAPEEQRRLGIPFGKYARGILWFLAQEVTRAKNQGNHDPRFIKIGGSLTEALENITGMQHRSGGPDSPRELLERQVYWLSHAHVSFRRGDSGTDGTSLSFASRYQQRPLWRPQLLTPGGTISRQPKEVSIRLNQDFYDELVEHSPPIDERIMKALWDSCLTMDLYVWLTWRANHIARLPGHKIDTLRWRNLMEQFGENYAESSKRRFRAAFKDAFRIVQQVYNPDDLDYVRLDVVSDKSARSGDGDKLILTVKGPSVPSEAVLRHNLRQFSAGRSAHIAGHRIPQPNLFGT